MSEPRRPTRAVRHGATAQSGEYGAGGVNISADRVEELINQHEDVEEVAVVGLPHADLGEELAAAVLLKPGANTTPAEIRGFMEGKAGYFEIPSQWWIREEPLPINANSKVLKHEIVATWPKAR